MPLVSEVDFDAICDARLKLFAAGEPPIYDASLFERLAEMASDVARQWAINAGYDISLDTLPEAVSGAMKIVALAELVPLAYARRQREVPPTLAARLDSLRESVRLGELPLSERESGKPRRVGGSAGGSARAVFASPFGEGATGRDRCGCG